MAPRRHSSALLKLNPNYASSYHWYSHLLIATGRFDESLAVSNRALELNPLDLEINIHLAWHYYFARDYDLTLEIARQTLEMDSTFSEAHWFRRRGLRAGGEVRGSDRCV